MKITLHTERMDSLGVHNDRNFNRGVSHIDPERTCDNLYWDYATNDTFKDEDFDKGQKHFRETEVEFYQAHFKAHLNAQALANKKNYKKNRDLTLKQYYKHHDHRPEDVILQIGDKLEHAEPEILWKCAMDYIKEFDKNYGRYCKILTAAMHVDEEGAPHVHLRRAWIGHDKWGNETESENKALKEMVADLDKSWDTGSKFSNYKVKFSQEDRKAFINICKNYIPEKELDVDESINRKRVHTFVYKQIAEEVTQKVSKVFEHTQEQLKYRIRTLEDDLRRERQARQQADDERAKSEENAKKAEEALKSAEHQKQQTEHILFTIYSHDEIMRKKYRQKLEDYKKLQAEDPKRSRLLKEIYTEEFGQNIDKR